MLLVTPTKGTLMARIDEAGVALNVFSPGSRRS
jgi:hypothetical protein